MPFWVLWENIQAKSFTWKLLTQSIKIACWFFISALAVVLYFLYFEKRLETYSTGLSVMLTWFIRLGIDRIQLYIQGVYFLLFYLPCANISLCEISIKLSLCSQDPVLGYFPGCHLKMPPLGHYSSLWLPGCREIAGMPFFLSNSLHTTWRGKDRSHYSASTLMEKDESLILV